MATENQSWDTSTAHIRRTLRSCIEHGKRARGSEGAELWEAYRLLGTALHTLEDLLAHSNWCEIALRKMGYKQVFCHVGDRGKPNRGTKYRVLTDFLISGGKHSERFCTATCYGHFRWCRLSPFADGRGNRQTEPIISHRLITKNG